MKTKHLLSMALIAITSVANAQSTVNGTVLAEVDFGAELLDWDGFGVNYVETSQTYDHEKYPQDYGGFSVLSQADKNEILELTFGDDGLQPTIIKLFLDPLHQQTEDGPFDHKRTTSNMRQFAKGGIELSAKRNEQLSFISTLYAGPAYTTEQNTLRGRDIRPDKLDKLADYIGNWADFLINEENMPLKYLSLHNEGESWRRWNLDGSTERTGDDYNVYMSPQVTMDMMRALRENLDKRGLKNVGVTNGETTNWYRFWSWKYAKEIANNKQALKDLSLITSHGFYSGYQYEARWYAPHTSDGIDLVRSKKPSLHAWTTSMSWNLNIVNPNDKPTFIMDPIFLKKIHGNIYEAHVNAIIPWAYLQRPSNWKEPDPNPGCGIKVYDDGTWQIQKAYYYYKQATRAGKPGMKVVEAYANETEIAMIAFEKGKTDNPNAFILANWGGECFDVRIKILDSDAKKFKAYRTSGREVCKELTTAERRYPEGENYQCIGDFEVKDGYLIYEAKPFSATTFFEE